MTNSLNIPKHNIMLDLETYGVSPGCAIMSIGAVVFDPYTKTLGEEFYRVINLESNIEAKLSIDGDTLNWWYQQSREASKALTLSASNSGSNLKDSLLDFWGVINKNMPTSGCMWGNGSDFDQPILAEAYKKLDLKIPWKFRNNRCYRTMTNLLGKDVDFERVGTYHNALDDAKSQAMHLMKILNQYL